MYFKPHAYQEYARDWIIEKPEAGVFLDMGLGKTACTLSAVCELMHNSFEIERVLVIAPLRVARDTWCLEVDKWDQFKYLKLSKVMGKPQKRMKGLNRGSDIYIINRENVEWLVNYLGEGWCFDMVVIDELSSFKSSTSKRFKALKRVRKHIKRIVGLTGTPAPNGLLDLWAQIDLLDGGARLGTTFMEYKYRYFFPDKRRGNFIYSWRLLNGAEGKIYDRLKDICMSMKAEDYISLPKRVNNCVEVNLPPSALNKYLKLEEELSLSLEGGKVSAANAAVLGGKLLQLASGAVYDEDKRVHHIHDEKLEALDEIIEAANGRTVLIFYYFRHDLDRIKKHLEGRSFRVLDKSEDILEWNRGEIPIMLIHPASAGHGLNLQYGGNITIWFTLLWSLELYQQANARLFRQGQREHVIINHIIAKGTIDEDVMKVLLKKEARQEDLLEAVKARLKRKNSWRVG